MGGGGGEFFGNQDLPYLIEGQDSGLKVCMGYRMLGYASAILSFFQHEGCSGSDHDFVTNSYGESWDSSCEQITSPTPEPLSPSSKNNTSKS